jgi:ribonucleoside-diphosphate reductase alpha chain
MRQDPETDRDLFGESAGGPASDGVAPGGECREEPAAAEPDLSANAVTVLRKRYLRRTAEGEVTETPADMLWRVARTVASAEERFGGDSEGRAVEFYNLMAGMEFLPNSPTLMNAGRRLGQLSACFVLPVEDSMESIFEAVKHTALIHKSGGGTGFSFSRIRPRDDAVHSTKGVSSGPLSFMTVFDKATETVKQGGVRRGANMAVLRVDHPDILDFIDVKRDMGRLNNFNLSVAVTDSFMDALEKGDRYRLVNPRTGEPTGSLDAGEVFGRLVDAAWSSGEPGLIFIDRMNEANPTPNVGEIEATNPCGEQPLLPYEACNLGSVNLSRMVTEAEDGPGIDWPRLGRVVRKAVRFLDDVIEVNRYPLPQIERMVAGNRKIGLGVMGFADMLFRLGVPYDSREGLDAAENVMSFIADRARQASTELARERGPFPNFRGSTYQQQGLPEMRNATVTTIAPTGSISIIAGCSSGVEPAFALTYTRRNLLDDGDELREANPHFRRAASRGGFLSDGLLERVAEEGGCQGVEGVPEEVSRVFVTSHDIAPSWHVRMQAAFQKYTDNAVSKTVNMPRDATREDVAEVFTMARKLRCKGVTIYRDGSRDRQVLNIDRSPKPETEEEPREAPPPDAGEPRPRPELTTGSTRRIQTGCGKLFVTINSDEAGPFEIFTQMGKAGGCAASQAEAISRLVSLALRSGIPPANIWGELTGISCHRVTWQKGVRIMSCADAIGKALQWHDTETAGREAGDEGEQSPGNLAGACPNCGGPLKYESGCVACALDCGYSECG